jgi:DNA-binding transcriptional MocR family regulator
MCWGKKRANLNFKLVTSGHAKHNIQPTWLGLKDWPLHTAKDTKAASTSMQTGYAYTCLSHHNLRWPCKQVAKKRRGYLHPQTVLMTLVLAYSKPIALADAKHPVWSAAGLFSWLQVQQPRQLVTHACNHGKQVQWSLVHRPLRFYAHPTGSAPQAIVAKTYPPTC